MKDRKYFKDRLAHQCVTMGDLAWESISGCRTNKARSTQVLALITALKEYCKEELDEVEHLKAELKREKEKNKHWSFIPPNYKHKDAGCWVSTIELLRTPMKAERQEEKS